MSEFKRYKKKGTTLIKPYVKGDIFPGLPNLKEGDYIAYNPNNPNDKWSFSSEYFKDNYRRSRRGLNIALWVLGIGFGAYGVVWAFILFVLHNL